MLAFIKRPIVIAVLLGALAVIGLVFLLSPQALTVDAADVRVGPIADAVSDQGVMRVRQAFVVASPVAGRLERLGLKVGDRVAEGQTIAFIRPMASDFLDPRSQAQARAAVAATQAALAAAQADVRSAASRRDMAERDLERSQSLAAQGIVSKQALETTRMAARTARSAEQAAIAQARAHAADLAAARAALIGPTAPPSATLAIPAPTRGIVTRVFQESERPVPSGAPILEIGDRAGLEAAIELLSQDATRIQEGQTAEIYDWGGAPLPAIVRRVEPQAFTKVSALGVEEQRVLVLLQISAPAQDWAGLGAGYRVWGRVFLRKADKAMLAPIGALVRSGADWAVYVIEHDHARLRRVRVGAMNDEDFEVLEGLKSGERVIAFPSDRIKEGVRVKSRPQGPPSHG